jgi:hypothetical protein
VAEYHRRTGIWRGRRGAGQVRASATLVAGQHLFTDAHVRLRAGGADEAVRLGTLLCERALRLVPRRFEGDTHLADVAHRLSDAEIDIAFVTGHERLVDWDGQKLWLSVDVAPTLGIRLEPGKNELSATSPEQLRGLELALALSLFAQLDIVTGASLRAALHWTAALYGRLGRSDRALLHGVLEGPHLDSGNLLSLFLRRAARSTDDESRDRWVTWILGQDRIDLPYDRQAASEILASDADVDEKRLLLYGILRDYDRDAEYDNIRRLAAQARASGQQLVFGRMSRAFHNQGTLFADAALLEPGDDWGELGDEAGRLAVGAKALQSPAIELKMLLRGSLPVSLIQIEGACERYEEAALDAQREALMARLRRARARVEDHGDEMVSRQPLPAIAPGDITELTTRRLQLVERVRTELLRAPSRAAAYVVISQRPSPTGSHLLVKINEFEEPYLGKADNLTKLVRLAGDRVYSSPDYRWLRFADHWIEAIPLFIKEEILIDADGEETTRTVIDIAGMEESFREEMADHWAENLRTVLDSEHVAAARLQLWREAGAPGDGDDETAALAWAGKLPPEDIAAAALLVRRLANAPSGELQRLVEEEEVEPFEALLSILSAAADDPRSAWSRTRDAAEASSWRTAMEPVGADVAAHIQRLLPLARAPRRPLPVLHVLTTQSAGMTQGYIRTWLEESMALYNVVAEAGLTDEVSARLQRFRRRLAALGARVVHELGIWVEVEEAAAEENLEESAAVARVVGRNRTVQEEVAVLGALLELGEERSGAHDDDDVDDPDELVAVIVDGGDELRDEALSRVVKRNGLQLQEEVAAARAAQPQLSVADATLRIVEGDELYGQDLETFIRFLARGRLLESWATERGADGDDRRNNYLRRFSRLSKTTARKQVLLERGLQVEALEPRHRYSAVGGCKRFHLLYTPSRVDLGHRERESVETWAQWVGGADRAAARVGRQIYGLINKSVRSFDSLTEPEVLKTGENASMASHFAFSNALSLMVSASGHGDVEEMGDQMSRRLDRIIHPAGEGYGGYCVPKDGLFLEFVLTLGRAEKLRQLGVPGEYHAVVARAAHKLLDRRDEFGTRFEWEAWAAQQLRTTEGLEGLFGVRSGDDGPVPVFQLPRLAEVLDGLGQPELRDPERVTMALAARWGIHKMVAGGEHVNRFMPFFKTWLLRRGVAEASRRHPDVAAAPVVVLTGEYKPDTQDGRFAVGMRKFEILCGTGDHLFHALDADGQTLASLLSEGYEAVTRRGRGPRAAHLLGLPPEAADTASSLAALFPIPPTPAEIRVVSPTGLSTQDLLGYTSDTKLESIAESARAELIAADFTDAEIDASLATFGPHPQLWATASPVAAGRRRQLAERLGGRIHALALQVLGPERTYERALQGADVLDTGIPHRALLDLLEDPSQVCRLMLEGNPDSALVIVDGASGARHRAMNRFDVMLWFAAGERFAREPVYVGIGLGHETVEGWRGAMRRQKRRAMRLGEALRAGDLEAAEAAYIRIVDEIRTEQEVQQQLAEVDRLRRFGRLRSRDELLVQSLARIAVGVPLEAFTFGDFLAVGGVFLLDGAHAEEIDVWCRDLGRPTDDGESARLVEQLVHPARPPQIDDFREEKGLESSNKASEDRPVAALEARRQLAQRVARARALNERAGESADVGESGFTPAYDAAMAALGDGSAPVTDAAFGVFIAHTRNALLALVSLLYDEDHADVAQTFVDHLSKLFLGREIDLEDWRQIAGGYEDVGDFGRLAQTVVERDGAVGAASSLEQIARGAELFYILLAVETTLPTTRPEVEPDAEGLWRALADFFAETINDHFYEYSPWVYSRGIGYAHLSGQVLYELCVRRHEWLARYLRQIVVRYTEVAHLPEQQQDLLLGNFAGQRRIDPIGVSAPSLEERRWRAYGQLRELAFIRNDGFPLPVVFADFDPDVIAADRRVNHVIALPMGRTHYSRALREGPTLAADLESQGRPGANLIMTRRYEIVQRPGQPRPVVEIDSGHVYVSASEYADALVRHAALDESEAAQRAAACHPKGIRLAVRFLRPVRASVVYPFHGDPDYDAGRLEDCGLPYSVQSLFHTWTTYDKAKYPDIFDADSGVDVPREIDWLAVWTRRSGDERTVKGWIESGLNEVGYEGGPYSGLRAFADRHRLVMVKDAAESGGRNARAFVLRKLASSEVDEVELERAVDFIYQISLRHNVAIQEVIVASPECWATDDFMDSFVQRQIVEWGSPVERRRRPKSPLYGSHRVIVSTDDPTAEVPLEDKWHLSHWITLNSKQLITNVGRGGSLEQFLPEFVHPAHQETLFAELAHAARRVMKALSAYERRSAQAYTAETGREIGRDLMGVSYGIPRYMMLDFLVTPRFAEPGDLVEIRREVDSEPVYILQRDGMRFPGSVRGWRVVLIEPNIGVGLWDRVALREEFHEREASRREQRPFDWSRVGDNARIVLRDLSRGGEDYLQAMRTLEEDSAE